MYYRGRAFHGALPFLFGIGFSMFKVEGNILWWGDSQYEIPAECQGKEIKNIYGTATSGLRRQVGIFLRSRRGDSVEVASEKGNISGRLVGDSPSRGTLVYLREQLKPGSGLSFWLVSTEEIKNDVNWINVEFEHETTLRLCPFTLDYWIINGIRE